MADTIKLIELPVGAGKTFHMLNRVNEMDGDVIFATPTLMLCSEVFQTLTELTNDDTQTALVTSESTGTGQKVYDLIYDELSRVDSKVNLICTHAGLSCTEAAILRDIKREKGSKLTVVIDELPSLFKSYSQRFSTDLKSQLETVIHIDDGKIIVRDEALYQQVIEYEFYNSECIQLLKLLDTVTMVHAEETNDWLFHGYELDKNLINIMKMADEVYLMASTITGTLDELILKDICGFQFEKAADIYTRIDTDALIDRAKRANIIPLLDKAYSKTKALGRDYHAKSGQCLKLMMHKAKALIQSEPAIMVSNNWAIEYVRNELEGVDTIAILPPNVKGINTHQDKHWCCALYTAKPTPAIGRSLQLLSEHYGIEKRKLLEAYSLQYDLDMITQMCGRISIRDNQATEQCTFIVPDRISAQHLVFVLTGNVDLYKQLVDESHMLIWDDISDTNTQIGRPLSAEKLLRLEKLEMQIIEAESKGVRLPRNKVLATLYGVKPAQISKDLKVIKEKREESGAREMKESVKMLPKLLK
jgi:hypothetical protein